MNKYIKYEFTDLAKWSTFQKKIQVKSTDLEGNEVYTYKDVAVVELGHICKAKDEEGECIDLATTWAVDILWFRTLLPSFKPFEVYPNPCGIHTFAGCEGEYLKSFCEVNPTSEYCVIPDEDISE
jgi:hypothetical protein